MGEASGAAGETVLSILVADPAGCATPGHRPTQEAIVFDSNGIEILPTDRVCVAAVGYGARHADNGIIRPIVAMNRTRVVILDADGNERAIGGPVLSVMRRDGTLGFEHNRRQNNGN